MVHESDGKKVTEVLGDDILIRTPNDALQIMMDIAATGSRKIILHQANITPDFFDLKTRLAGEILQKFVNYLIQVAIVGNFTDVKSESLRAFIIESNRGKQICFANDFATAYSFLMTRDI
jgi:hypothetical protein